MCERSPRDIKLHYAFSIYDFDGDNFIGVSDIEQVIIRFNNWPCVFVCLFVRNTFHSKDSSCAKHNLGIGAPRMPIQFKITFSISIRVILFLDHLEVFYNPFARKFIYFKATRLLTQGQLTDEEIEQIWRKILEETDIDDDKKLSNNEFTHVINKCPDFLTTFNVRI